ncbi:prolyl 3-hydroxylase OGFOD1-like [Lytechinus pictus]|uniref:prolyl 3-hydroxylase OGFOD1-like n=1 Tax=Lytechinus pictus TaxID=7653 RepID=UPI0030BA2728
MSELDTNSKRDLSDEGQPEAQSHESLPCKKKQKTNGAVRALSHPVEINDKYMEKSFKDCIRAVFNDGVEATHIATEAAVITNPFTCCVLPNFVKDETFLKGLKTELLELDFNSKSNDLYKFQQSGALQNYSSSYISALKKLLYEDFLSWLREVTGIPFSNKFDLTCSKYNYTDVLLCHDDELEGRRVAFILYLVPKWTKKDGGLLDLFDMDDHGQPKSVVKSLVPEWNNFVFFEVTPKSFHQVSEILNPDKCRLSVSGWFHGPTVPRPAPYLEPRCSLTPHVDTQESLFYDWINESYMDLGNQSEVQDTFSDESEIQLSRFFEKEKYEAVLTQLQSPDIRWERRGPANKRHYKSADLSSLPPVIHECLSVMQSEQMFLLLSNFTALRLHSQAPCSDDDDEEEDDEDKKEDMVNGTGEKLQSKEDESESATMTVVQDGDRRGEETRLGEKQSDEMKDEEQGSSQKDDINLADGVVIKMKGQASIPRCRAEVRRWSHGCYTLLHDTDTEGSEFALDASVFFDAKGVSSTTGGFVSYIAKGEDEELLSVLPEDNALSLVYRDKETLRFVKHINHSYTTSRGSNTSSTNSQSAFYELYLVYYE